MAATPEPYRGGRPVTVSRRPLRPPSLLRGSAQALDATQALLRSEAALVRWDVQRWAGAMGLSLVLLGGAGVLLVAAWTLALVAAVLATDAVALPIRLAAVALLHGLLAGGLLLWRARLRRNAGG